MIRLMCIHEAGERVLASIMRSADGQRYDFSAKQFAPRPSQMPFVPPMVPMVEVTPGVYELNYAETADRVVWPDGDYVACYHLDTGIAKRAIAAAGVYLVNGDDATRPAQAAPVTTTTITVVGPAPTIRQP